MNDKKASVFKCDFTPFKPSPNSSPDAVAAWADNRAFFSCHAEGTKKGIDVMDYLFAENKVEKPTEDQIREEAAARLGLSGTIPDKSQAHDIEQYITRFNTIGAFGRGGTMTRDEVEEWRNGAQSTKSNFWHGYLSIPFTPSLHMDNDKMQCLCRQTFGTFLKNAGFDPNNIAAIFSVHNDKPHKHFHFVFYEKSPKYINKRGEAQYRWKGKIPQNILDDYRLATTAYMDEHKEDFYSYRDRAMNALRSMTGMANSDAELFAALSDLGGKLPKSGRLQYNSENIAPYRTEIDGIALALLRRNPEAYNLHCKALKEISRRGKELAELKRGSADYSERMTSEYKSRLGNIVLGLCKQMRFDPKGKADIKTPKTSKQHKAAARRKNTVGMRTIRTFIKSLGSYQANIRIDFTREMERVEREIEQNQQQSS